MSTGRDTLEQAADLLAAVHEDDDAAAWSHSLARLIRLRLGGGDPGSAEREHAAEILGSVPYEVKAGPYCRSLASVIREDLRRVGPATRR